MIEILNQMLGQRVLSIRRNVAYLVATVEPGHHVTLRCDSRVCDSILAWRDIERVYSAALAGEVIRPSTVDIILDNPQYRESSTMSALVREMCRSR